MATWYRWSKYNTKYVVKEEEVDGRTTITMGTGLGDSVYVKVGTTYGLSQSSGTFSVGGDTKSKTLEYVAGWSTGYHQYGVISPYNKLYVASDGQMNWQFRDGTLTVDGTYGATNYVYTSELGKGSFVSYAYSTSSSAYPNGGVQDGYYYDSQTTSIPAPQIKNFIVPSLVMENQSVPITWDNVILEPVEISYQLQRKTNGGNWETIYTGSNNSYVDTASNWNTVQYQVAGVINNAPGNYTISNSIPVVSAQALVISGSDGDLGTLTANVPYTVSSNTGNQISLTRSVNGIQVATININSGFAYNIPITDLPTGANTISITAQVQASSGQITQTRTWTYYKEPINIPDSGGISQLVQNNQNIWPVTLAECIKVPTYFGNTLDKALELIAPVVKPTIIAAGTYTGTGQYGSSAPNILNFSTQPLLVLVYGPNISLSISTTNSSSPAYITGTQAKWYSNISAEEQLNSSGIEYSYIAIVKT